MEKEPRHQCMVYEGPPSKQLAVIAAIIKQKLDSGYRCLFLNSPTMVAGMGSTLAALGIDVTLERETKRVVLSSETAQAGQDFDGAQLLGMLEGALDEAIADGYKGLWASGDLTWEFGPGKDFSKLLEYELGLEKLFKRRQELSGICQYHHDTLPKDVMRQGLLVHPGIVINETLKCINPHYLISSWPAAPDTIHQLDESIAALCAMGNV